MRRPATDLPPHTTKAARPVTGRLIAPGSTLVPSAEAFCAAFAAYIPEARHRTTQVTIDQQDKGEILALILIVDQSNPGATALARRASAVNSTQLVSGGLQGVAGKE